MQTSRNGVRRAASWLTVTVCVLLAGVLLGGRGASAAGGTWGVGQYPYENGSVCTAGSATVPYASWNVGAAAPDYPAFLTTPLASDGTTDSGAPPIPQVGAGSETDVLAGEYGFASDADIAVYARLIATADASGDAETAAETARAVFDTTSPGLAPFYCAGDPSAALAAAQATAGPYTVSVSVGSTKAIPTQENPAVATVTSASGNPVPGVKVTLTSSSAQVQNATATTDSSGSAQFQYKPPPGATGSVQLQASISEPTGLSVVQATTAPTPSNPNGTVSPAVLPSPPTPTIGQVDAPVDTSASPVLHAHGSVAALTLQGTVTPTVDVTGLRGHSASVSFTIYGPTKLDPAKACQGVTFGSGARVVATTTPQTQVGDGTVTAQPFTPKAVGCYGIVASLKTLDATPQASATSSGSDPASIVAVVDTTATFRPGAAVAGKGPLTGTVTVAHASGAQVTAGGSLAGPVAPSAAGTCVGVDFGKAASVSVGDVHRAGDGAAALTSAPTKDAGCYLWKPSVSISLPGIDTLAVPVAASATDVLVLAPVVSLSVDRTWSVSPEPVGTHVAVTGLYGAKAHVTIRMVRVPEPYTGCTGVDFAGAVAVSTGPATAITGDGSFAVATGSTPQLGCYQPLPTLSVDGASPAITLAATVGDPLTVINVGAAQTAPATAVDHGTGGGSSHTEVWVTLIVTTALEIATVIAVVVFARRRAVGEPDGAPLRLV